MIVILTLLNSKKTRFDIIKLKVHFKNYDPKREDISAILEKYEAKINNYTKENIIGENDKEYRYVYEIGYKGFIDNIEFLDSFADEFEDISYIELV